MNELSTVHNTFVLERSYPKTPAQVFAAFEDPARKRLWFGTGEHHTLEEFTMEFQVGGAELFRYRFNERSLFPGVELVNRGLYLDIVPEQRLVIASSMAMGGRRISASLVTFQFLTAGAGTDLVCTHQGVFFEGSDGPQIREAGWQTLLGRLSEQLDA